MKWLRARFEPGKAQPSLMQVEAAVLKDTRRVCERGMNLLPTLTVQKLMALVIDRMEEASFSIEKMAVACLLCLLFGGF